MPFLEICRNCFPLPSKDTDTNLNYCNCLSSIAKANSFRCSELVLRKCETKDVHFGEDSHLPLFSVVFSQEWAHFPSALFALMCQVARL